MNNNLLPIGSVVLLKNSSKRVMISGFLQKSANNPEAIWDYTGVLYPEGYMAPDRMYMFNGDQIEKVYALGYQDEEQFAFMEVVERKSHELKGNNQGM